MEKYKKILILILISLNMVSVVYSQNDSTWTIRTKPGFSIDYIAGFKNVYPYYAEIIDIKKLSFITDSTVKVSIEDSYEEINIDYINEISFKSGNKFLLGLGIGAVTGLIVGFLGGAISENPDSELYKVAVGGSIMLGISAGAFLGGIIGTFFPSEKDSLTLSAVKVDKKDRLIKFFKRNNKTERR